MSDAAGGGPAGSSDAASSVERSRQEYIEEKYGQKDAHVNLTREEVQGMLDRVLATSNTVQYLLESLKLVRDSWKYCTNASCKKLQLTVETGNWQLHIA